MSARSRFDRILLFLARPLGGIELETFIALFGEMWWACSLAFCSKAAWYTPSLRFLYGEAPGYILAIPWFVASLLSLSGVVLYGFGNPRCAIFRWWGSFISLWLWFWTFSTSAFATGAEIPQLGFYLGACIASGRIMLGAWRRGAWRRPG